MKSHIPLRAKRASREKFLDALKEVPDVEPPDYDRLPEGHERAAFEKCLAASPDVPPLPGDEL